jgi:hypothetical protein
MLDYARHAQSGRMHWSRVSADISYPEHPIRSRRSADQRLDRVVTHPPRLTATIRRTRATKALKAKLAELRGVTEDTSKRIAEGD